MAHVALLASSARGAHGAGEWAADLMFLAGDICAVVVAGVYLHKHHKFFRSWRRVVACGIAVLVLLVVFHLPNDRAAAAPRPAPRLNAADVLNPASGGGVARAPSGAADGATAS